MSYSYLITTWFGSFLLKDDKIIKSELFPKKGVEIAKRLKLIEKGKILDEEKKIIEKVGKFYVIEKRLKKIGGILLDKKINLLNLAKNYGFTDDLLHEATLELGKMKLGIVKKDKSIIQAVGAIDDLNKSINLLGERMTDWLILYFPNYDFKKKAEELIKIIAEKNWDMLEESRSILESDKRILENYAQSLYNLYKTRENLEKFVESYMQNIAPNLSYLVGPIISARLISYANGLEKLASMPSSTIQLLGAEKAFFRHLKENTKMPKHGIIFQNPLIHRAPYWQRGKISRAFASKIAIAARTDFYSDKFIGEDLEKDFIKRVKEIRKKYPKSLK